MESQSESENDSDKVQEGKQIKIRVTDKDVPLSFAHDRHLDVIEGLDWVSHSWRMKERMKTVSVALVLCLNVGVDPPDIVKTQPCARLECWIDPATTSPPKALEKIGHSLQLQYERWQPRARYKQSLDPTSDEVKKLCTSLRRNAKEERVLFHYNGHGVPKPTTNGEIWVFNRTYTQYIPLSIYDLQTWMGAPSIYVYDCSNAGIIVESFKSFAAQHESEYEQQLSTQSQSQNPRNSQSSLTGNPSFNNCIQLAACSSNQVLPMNPDLPADLFTACLTTPIKVAVRWFVLQATSKLVPQVNMELVDKIPGSITDRRTMLGELNWIFTAITDTIAWNTLPRGTDLFQKLFRQDLLVASLFRNFLLAERILRSCDCTPVSSPPLPETHDHPMWAAWDLALDLSLGQLHNILVNKEPFKHLPFFEEQLTAFQVWLELGSEERKPPEQLPIVLQVLLSQVHRVRALELLGKFLDLGPWAVNLALSVGIFPYVLKLLQSNARELRHLLVFIWAKILAIDNVSPNFQTCQSDLVRDGGHKYFLLVLQDTSLQAESRTQAAFVLACIVSNYRDGQVAAMQGNLVSNSLEQLNDSSAHLRQWVAIALGRLWDNYEKARWNGVRDVAPEKLYKLLDDPCPQVRAAAVYALGTFINSVKYRSEHANNIDHAVIVMLLKNISGEMSSLVRKEIINALQWVILTFEHVFVNIALKDSNERIKRVASSSSIVSVGKLYTKNFGNFPTLGFGSIYMKCWTSLCALESDPCPDVAKMSSDLTRYVRELVKELPEHLDSRGDASMSMPASPNKGSGYLSYSPPTGLHSAVDLHKSTKSPAAPTKTRKPQQSINEESGDASQAKRRALVETKFVEWASKRFAQSAKKKTIDDDQESKEYHERDWRFMRNKHIRDEAEEEQKSDMMLKTDVQKFQTRTALPPSLLQFHPFDQQIAVAGRDSFAIWDWGTGAKTTAGHNKSSKFATSKVTALEWINGHDMGMLMVAADDGSVRVWRPNVGVSREPTLVGAWQAFNERRPMQSGIHLSWEQWTQTALTAGDPQLIRGWDAERELSAFDIPTGCESPVTCIDSTFSTICHEKLCDLLKKYDRDDDELFSKDRSGNGTAYSDRTASGLVVAGCADGSVRLFDRRCSTPDTRVNTWMEHKGAVLGVQIRENMVISGSSEGDVKIYDIRKNDSIYTSQISQNGGMSCIAIHRSANYYACGSANQFVNIYTLKGVLLNSIRTYEGFMGHRIGPVTCLSYHPHKVVLAAGSSDCNISVYTVEGRR